MPDPSRILVAEDDPVTRRMLEKLLQSEGFEVTLASDGEEAWNSLREPSGPKLAVMDWMMPKITGVDVCRQLRNEPDGNNKYVLLLTAKTEGEHIVEGFEAGVDDYLVKPFRKNELIARIRVGERILNLQGALAKQVNDLKEALSEVRKLQGLLPICSYCKNIRDDNNYWLRIEEYIADHSEANFSHGICPECEKKLMEKLKK